MAKENINNNKEIKFIVLYGEPKSGKTTTLNKLALDIFSKIKFEDIITLDISITDFIKNDHIYKFRYQDKMILIITAGDNANELIRRLKENIANVDIVFCAIRAKDTNGRRYKKLKRFIEKNKGEIKNFFKEKSANNDSKIIDSLKRECF